MTEKEYNECVNLYADNVYRFILKNLRHEEDAKDVVQTAFEKMWNNRGRIEMKGCKSYLFTVAYNQMIDHIRKSKRISLKEKFDAKKVDLLLNELYPGENRDIPDPWSRPESVYHEVFELIDKACDSIIAKAV